MNTIIRLSIYNETVIRNVCNFFRENKGTQIGKKDFEFSIDDSKNLKMKDLERHLINDEGSKFQFVKRKGYLELKEVF